MDNTVSEQGMNSRVRMNLSTTAKGFVQWDVTVEFPSLAESKDNLSSAIDEVKALIKAKGLEEAKA